MNISLTFTSSSEHCTQIAPAFSNKWMLLHSVWIPNKLHQVHTELQYQIQASKGLLMCNSQNCNSGNPQHRLKQPRILQCSVHSQIVPSREQVTHCASLCNISVVLNVLIQKDSNWAIHYHLPLLKSAGEVLCCVVPHPPVTHPPCRVEECESRVHKKPLS